MARREYADEEPAARRGMLPWFWLGAGMGFLFSAAAVVIATELTRKRYRVPGPDHVQDEYDLVQDLTSAVSHGLGYLAGAAGQIGSTFLDAARERIRYGLSPGDTGGGESAWYYDDETQDQLH